MDKVELAKKMSSTAVACYNHYCDVPANQGLQDRLFTAIFEVITGEFPTFEEFDKYVRDYQKVVESESEIS